MSDVAHALKPIPTLSPLHGRAMASLPGVTLEERPLAGVVQIAAWPGTAEAVDAALAREGLPGQPAPNRAARNETATMLNIAPGRSLVLSERPDLYIALDGAVPFDTGVVTDLGHARARLRVSGPRAAWVLAKGVQIDLHDSAFPVDAVAVTQFDHIGVVLHRAAQDRYDLLVYRGFAEALLDALEMAGRGDGHVGGLH